VVVQDLLENDAALTSFAPKEEVTWDACATHKDCDSCLNASLTCHFCQKDFQCHTIGSSYGCLVGVSVCHHLEGASTMCHSGIMILTYKLLQIASEPNRSTWATVRRRRW
jgi:hypothetical protein